jgi:putative resolvase
MSKFVPSRKAAETLGLHPNTLRRLADQGKIEYIRTPGGQRIYNVNSFISNRVSLDEFNKVSVCYCRVSSAKQSDDLAKQIEYLRTTYPEHEVISDVASSLNYKRKGLQRILELASAGELKEVVVAHKDRLGRFGFELIQQFIELNGGRLVVLNNRAVSKETELAEDLIRIITFYTARYYGSRKYKVGANDESTESRTKLRLETDTATQEMVRCLTASIQFYDKSNTTESTNESEEKEVKPETNISQETPVTGDGESSDEKKQVVEESAA